MRLCHALCIRRGVLFSPACTTFANVCSRYLSGKNLHGLKESVAINLPTNVGLAILLGVVLAVLLTPTTVLKMRMMLATSGISICGCATQDLLAVFH